MYFRVLLVGFSLFRPGAARAPVPLNIEINIEIAQNNWVSLLLVGKVYYRGVFLINSKLK